MLAAILFLGILTMWVPARWALSAFQTAIFAVAAVHIVRNKRLTMHPTAMLLGAAVMWGLIQASAGWSVDRFKTLNEVLNWTTNLAVFALGLELSRDERQRERRPQVIRVHDGLEQAPEAERDTAQPDDRVR